MYQKKVNEIDNKMESVSGLMKHWLTFMSKKYQEDLTPEMREALQNEGGDSYDQCTEDDKSENYAAKDTSSIQEDSNVDVNSRTNEVHNMVHVEQQQQQSVHRSLGRTQVHTSTPHEQTPSKEAQLDGNVVTDLPSDPILHNMRTRRVQAASMGISESRQKQVYLISLINKGRVVAKGKLVTTDSQREILGAKLGPKYCGVLVEGLENIELGNIIDEEVPRPSNQIRTLIDAIGYVIPWPITHVKQARSSSCTRNKLVPAARGQS